MHPRVIGACRQSGLFFPNLSLDDYLPEANKETCVVVQVESVEGMKNVEAIAAVEGVDVVFAGPMDLSAAMGFIGQTKRPERRPFWRISQNVLLAKARLQA